MLNSVHAPAAYCSAANPCPNRAGGRFSLLVLGFLLLVLLPAQSLLARGSRSDMSGELAIGMATPAPTGISIKFWASRDTAYDIFSEWSFSDNFYHFHADYLIHDFNQVYADAADAPVYYGFGVRVEQEKGEDTVTGARIPFGISYLSQTTPFDLFAEAAPRIDLTPSTNFGVDVQVGIRYRF